MFVPYTEVEGAKITYLSPILKLNLLQTLHLITMKLRNFAFDFIKAK